MRLRPTLKQATLALLGGATLLLGACREAGSTRIVGPDGSPMAHVHCGAEQGACFRIAGELCPTGYELKAITNANDGNFLVRCRAAGAVVAQAPAPAPAALAMPAPPAPAAGPALSSTRSTPSDGWPPSAEPSPASYPWPASQPSAGSRPAPTSPSGDVDIGY